MKAGRVADAVTCVEVRLVNGAVRLLDLPASTGSTANALSRLDDWIETADGGWVQKSHVVEVRKAEHTEAAGAAVEYEALDVAAGSVADEAGPSEQLSRSLAPSDHTPDGGM